MSKKRLITMLRHPHSEAPLPVAAWRPFREFLPKRMLGGDYDLLCSECAFFICVSVNPPDLLGDAVRCPRCRTTSYLTPELLDGVSEPNFVERSERA